MKTFPAPQILIRHRLQRPHANTVATFPVAGLSLRIAGWFIRRNLRPNETGLRAPTALGLALLISAMSVFGAERLAAPANFITGGATCELAGLLFLYADHRRFIHDPAGKVVADRWQIVLTFADFRWTRDKANRHFFFSGDTGPGKTSGMNGLLAALVRRNPTLSGVLMANKGDEWFYPEGERRIRDFPIRFWPILNADWVSAIPLSASFLPLGDSRSRWRWAQAGSLREGPTAPTRTDQPPLSRSREPKFLHSLAGLINGISHFIFGPLLQYSTNVAFGRADAVTGRTAWRKLGAASPQPASWPLQGRFGRG